MRPTFVPWWILFLTAGIFLGLALSLALEARWGGAAVATALGGASIWAGLVYRNRLRRLTTPRR